MFPIAVLAVAASLSALPGAGKSLVEMLGFKPTDRVLIINADDFGMCHSHNVATIRAMTRGVCTSATVMMPTPWIWEVVEFKRQHPEADIGIHLTLTSEWRRYKWRPVLGLEMVPSLVNPDTGAMWAECEEVWAHANPDEIYRELRAQILLAIRLGLEPTHLDNHMGSLQTHPELWRIYLRLAREFDLPVRMASEELYAKFGAAGRRKIYAQRGILGPDVLIYGIDPPSDPDARARFYNALLEKLEPGKVTELYLHPAVESEELRNIAGSHRQRHGDYLWLISNETRRVIERLGIKLIGYRPIRELQRRLRAQSGR